MKELAQVRQAVIDTLNTTGLTALEAFPNAQAKTYNGPVAAVAVGTAEGKALGFCNYLGEAYDENTGAVREIYGKQLEGNITVDIRAQRASDCETGCIQAAEALLTCLPSGIKPGELRWENLGWEKTTSMFLRRGNLRCQAAFVAESQENNEAFLDFILKGVMQN